jgi:hypothetical protein
MLAKSMEDFVNSLVSWLPTKLEHVAEIAVYMVFLTILLPSRSCCGSAMRFRRRGAPTATSSAGRGSSAWHHRPSWTRVDTVEVEGHGANARPAARRHVRVRPLHRYAGASAQYAGARAPHGAARSSNREASTPTSTLTERAPDPARLARCGDASVVSTSIAATSGPSPS